MDRTGKTFEDIDEYVASHPKDVAQRLKTIQRIVKKAAPDATEHISYNIPAFKLNGILIYFAAFKNHIGMYPYKDSMKLTKKELEKYRTSKGTLQFQHDQDLPLPMIEKAVKHRVKEQLAKKPSKMKKK